MPASPESRKAVERRERLARARAARARRDPAVGLVLIWSGVGIWMVIFLVLVVLWLEGVNLGSWPGVTAAPVVVVSLALVTRGRRMRVGGAERVLTEDCRAPVVYLRPFGADGAEIAKRVSSRVRIAPSERVVKTYEERLAHALRKIGPFVAVGNPAERLPLLGAARMYAADEDWQAAVGDLIGRAAVVLLHAGEGHGLDWEVHHVIDRGLPERTIVSLPLDAKRGEPSRQERYAAFRRRSDDIFPRPLPEAIGHCQFAYFDADWTPQLLGERGAALPDGEDERARALRRLAYEFKITWGPLWARMVVYCAAFLGGLAGLEALISSAG
jgi:hypothetical protein